MDNLIAEKKARPMIIVMDNLNAVKPGTDASLYAARGSIARRTMLGATAAACAVALTGCDDDTLREAEFLKMVKDLADDVDKAVDAIESTVGDFDLRNWREVVGNLRTDVENLRDSVDKLKQSLEPSDTV